MVLDSYYDATHIKVLRNFVNKLYRYDECVDSYVVSRLVESGGLMGHAIHIKNGILKRYIRITPLGETLLEFNDL